MATGTRELVRLPLALLALLVPVLLLTLVTTPAGTRNWLLETGPGLAGIAALAVTFKRFPMSKLVYVCVLLHVLVLVFGAQWTYAHNPLGEWMRGAFGFSRNNYDKIGHFAQGFFPALVVAEVLLRLTPLNRGGWLKFLVCSVVLALSACYELFEWWAAVLLDPAGGDAFLGTQGYVWDAQSDMAMALLGSIVAMAGFSRLHARSMERLLGPGRWS